MSCVLYNLQQQVRHMHVHWNLGEALGLHHAIWWIHDLQLTNIDLG